MRNLVIQYYIDIQKYSQPGFNNLKPSPMETYSSHSLQLYCKKYDIDYLKITEPKVGFKHPTWERFDLWVDRDWWKKYDQIMYVDSDVIALDHAPNIFEMYPSITNELKTVYYPKFRSATPEGAKYNQRVNPLADSYSGSTIAKRFVQPGVMLLNKENTNFMLPWIGKYKEVTDDRIDDGMFLNHCIVESKVPLLDMNRKFNFKNNGERFDYNNIYFLHCAGGKKHKKEVKIWPKLRKIFPDLEVDLSGLED
tara:strand:- start:468 stop:1223 length:756 start_codon:yes stop_codon:yes gene_type:complete